MKIVEVTDRSTKSKFNDVCATVYAEDSQYVRPLDKEVESTFTSDLNPFFNHGEIRRWIAEQDGRVVGRIAAFINYNKAFNNAAPAGGIGFFECISDHNVAFAMFDQCSNWLTERGMKAMDGPINFGENNNN